VEGSPSACRHRDRLTVPDHIRYSDPCVRLLSAGGRGSATCHWPAVRARAHRGGTLPGPAVTQARASGSLGSGLVLLDDAGGDAPAGADRDVGLFRPCPDTPAAVPAGCGPRRPAALSPSGLAGMIEERCELAAERCGVLLAQIDLIRGAIDPEPHRLGCRAPSRSSWSSTVIFCAIAVSWLAGLSAPRSTVLGAGGRGAASHLTGCTRPAERGQLSGAPAGAARQVCLLPTRIVLSYLTL
jgi:hypothetical protein